MSSYSPQFNPCEQYFAHVKKIVREKLDKRNKINKEDLKLLNKETPLMISKKEETETIMEQ